VPKTGIEKRGMCNFRNINRAISILVVCSLDKKIPQSPDLAVNRLFVKLFKTSNIEIVHYCQTLLLFGCELPVVQCITGEKV